MWFFKKSYQYHFIHIPKNGGNSIRKALKKRNDVLFTRPFHYRYIDVIDDADKPLNYFSLVRNPWARTASRYIFGRQNAAKWKPDDPRRVYILQASFEDFVRDQKIFTIPRHPEQPWMGPLSSWFNQLEWLRDKNGQPACDCLRLEYADKDLSAYFGEKIVLPRKNVSREKYSYQAMYTPQLIDMVAGLFKDDIDYFGFDFDSPASRNIVVR